MAFLSKKLFIAITVVLAALGVVFTYKAGRTITVITGSGGDEFWEETISDFPLMPEPEKNRIDILLIGIRGYDGSGEWGKGEWLADTIILASFNTENNQAALVSIPRDLYVDIPEHGKDKINAVYAIGETKNFGGGGLQLTKAVLSQLTGVYIDYALSIDFKGFEKIIDHLGGVSIYRDTPFSESKQWLGDGREGARYWRKRTFSATSTEGLLIAENMSTSSRAVIGNIVEGWEFYVPSGLNTMNSAEVLYYARSRYSSSDFDRMRRQQEVVDAVKSKALNLGVLANPVKIFNILDLIEKNVRIDMSLSEIKDLVNLAQKVKIEELKKVVIDSSDDGLLVEDRADGMYVLLPKSGDYSEIQRLVRTIIEE